MRLTLHKLIFSSLLIFLVVIVDQVTKALVVAKQLNFVCNTGFAFGLGESWYINGFIAFLVLLVIVYFFLTSSYSSSPSAGLRLRGRSDSRSSGREVSSFALALVIGGGVSNILDRMVRGCVIDFIDLKIWPAFNLADVAITVGVGILIFLLLTGWHRRDKYHTF